MVKKPPIGAHYGLRDWLAQRATAAAMIISVIIIMAALLKFQPQGYEAWRAFITASWMRILLLTTILAIVWHGYIGARDIIMDYIKPDWFRLLKTGGLILYLLVCAIWAAEILL